MAFFVGQLVVTIADWGNRQPIEVPVRGVVYTVRSFEDRCDVHPGLPGLRLAEIHNEPVPSSFGPLEPAFDVQVFRPARTCSQSVFDSLTAPIKHMKREREGV